MENSKTMANIISLMVSFIKANLFKDKNMVKARYFQGIKKKYEEYGTKIVQLLMKYIK